jgi:hypothetical protein
MLVLPRLILTLGLVILSLAVMFVILLVLYVDYFEVGTFLMQNLHFFRVSVISLHERQPVILSLFCSSLYCCLFAERSTR